jgi:hypothetical protein
MHEYRVWTATMLFVMSTAGVAQQAIAPNLNPLPPWLRAPVGTHAGSDGQSLTFEWRQDLYGLNGERAARHFIVCLYAGSETCDSTALRWEQSATSIPRSELARNPAIVSGPPIVVAHLYSFAMPVVITAAQLDQPLTWAVGACHGEEQSSCTFSSAPLVLTTKDLTAENNSDGLSTAREIKVSGEVRNNGTTPSGRFAARMQLWQVTYDPSTDSCIRDHDPVDENTDDDLALTDRGELLAVRDLARLEDGTLDQSKHVIVAVISDPDTDRDKMNDVTVDASSLGVGRSAQVVEATDEAQAIMAFASRLTVDPDQAVAELNETDNGHGECHIIR